MNDRPTLAATHAVQSPGAPELTLTFGMVDFPGQMDTAGSAANDKGEIIGGYGPDVVGDTVSNHGFSLKGTKFTEIDYPGAGWTEPNAINDSGAMTRESRAASHCARSRSAGDADASAASGRYSPIAR